MAATKSPNSLPPAGARRHPPSSPLRRLSLCVSLVLCAVLFAAGCSRSATSPGSRRGIEQAREDLEQIPPPSKSSYLNVRDRDAYGNPFLVVNSDTVTLTIIFPDRRPAGFASGGMLRPTAARRKRIDVLLADLPRALAALPPEVWPYGRVAGIAESPAEPRADRIAIRRNVEATIQVLNDLGVVVDDWSGASSALVR